MDIQEINALLDRYRNGTASPEEKARLETWYITKASESKAELGADDAAQMIRSLRAQLPLQNQPRLKSLWIRLAAAASIVLVLSVGGYFLFHQQGSTSKNVVSVTHDIAPGGNRATLTLSNGKTIDLTGAKNGTLARQPGSVVSKNASGMIRYANATGADPAATYNTLQTPKGGQYEAELPDGTKVWLNAASSITYPTSFASLKERVVKLSGEAYFEVAHNRTKPFRVKTNIQTVEVLGTHFNIMAYSEEGATATTLLQGSVKVSHGHAFKTIKPGEQAVVNEKIVVREADTDAATAWKNGRTYFKDADIPAVMRSLSRWYNVDIEYRGAIPKRLFTGGIPRSSNLSELLKILEAANIHVAIQGRKLIVSP